MKNELEESKDNKAMLVIPPELDAILCSIPSYVLLVDETHHILYANSSVFN